MGALVAAMDHSCVDVSDLRDRAWQFLGLLRTWLGRLVVLGSGRECFVHALAGRHGANSFIGGYGKAWRVQKLDRAIGDYGIFSESAGHISGSLGSSDFGSCLRE